MIESSLLTSSRSLRIVLNVHALTLLVAAFLVGWNAEVCETVAGSISCTRSWPRTLGWWAAGVVSAAVPYFLGRFVREAARRLDQL